MTDQLNIAIAGAAGRMGRQLIRAAHSAGHRLTGGTEAEGAADLGADLGRLAGLADMGAPLQIDIALAAENADVWIDFTRPTATLRALNALQETSVRAVIIGTTGFSEAEEVALRAPAERFAIVKAGNFSLGVNLLAKLTQLAAERLGTDWDIEILEAHHKRKVDAPSGTALMLGEAAAEGRGEQLQTLQRAPYNGPDAARTEGEIGFAVRRSGGVIGEHEVSFGSETELISLKHVALDRSVFADGAIKAAEWAAGASPGYYSMDDVLGV